MLAAKYHLLPSEVLSRATTIDLMVSDVADSYRRHQEEVAQAKSQGRAPPSGNIPINTLQQMIERVRQ